MKRSDAVCRNPVCKHDFPHKHVLREGAPPSWRPTIDDPVEPAPWPERLQWERPDRRSHQFGDLFQFGWFCSHSGFQLPWKLDLESLSSSDWDQLAKIIAWKFAFRSVYGIPKGGQRLAQACDHYVTPGYPVLIVDDVATTGRSMEVARAQLGLEPPDVIGVVVVARGACPSWVWPILQVSEWAQSRATGLG